MNNNRNNSFIPNPQDFWNHPDLYPLNVNNQSNANGGQVPPFSAHQQVQQLQQGQYPMYSVQYTTASPNNLQPSFNPMFTQAWEGLDGNNGGGMQMNYSYQQGNPCYQNQHQQILQPHMMPQIVSQSPRVVPLPLDAPHFVPFSMSLSPSGSMVPFSLSSASSMHSSSVSLNSGSFNSTPMAHFTNNPSPQKIHVPLNSRSSGSPAPIAHNMSLNSLSRSVISPAPMTHNMSLNLNSRSAISPAPMTHNMSLNLNSRSAISPAPMTHNMSLNLNSRSAISPAPTTHNMSLNLNSRSSASPAPISHNMSLNLNSRSSVSPSPAVSHNMSFHLNSRSSASPAPISHNMSMNLNSRSSATPAPMAHNMSLNSRSSASLVPLSYSSQPSSTPLVPMPLNSRSFSNMVPLSSQSSGSMAPMSFNSRSGSSNPSTQLPFNSSFSTSTVPFNSRSSTPIMSMSQFSPNCGSPKIPVPLNSHSPASMTSFSTNSSPSPPPPPKKPPRQRKKKSPMRPLPVNPSTLPLPIDRSPPLPLYLNRTSGMISSNINSWPPSISHLSTPVVPVSGSRPSSGVPTSIHLSSPTSTAPTSVNRLFPTGPLPAHQSSVSVHRSPPMVPVSAHTSSPSVPLTVNRPSHALPVSVHSFPLAHIPVINRSSPSPVQPAASFNTSPTKMPLPINTSPPAPIIHQQRNPSPPKANLTMSRLSVLHYAPERAATPASSNNHDEMENVHVFQEEEILKLVGVGELPDQSAELQSINPIHEVNMASVKVKSEVNDTTSISSWEQDAFKGAANSPPGDEDLETELKRFYCPPSPPKSLDAKPTKRPSTDPETTSTSTTLGTTTVSNTQTNIGGNRRKSAQKIIKPDPDTPPPKKSSAQSRSGKAFIELSSDDDDDLKVLLVKVGDKRRRPSPAGARRGVPPKKVQVQTRGRGQSSKHCEIKRVPSPNMNRYAVLVEQRRAGPSTENKQMDPRLKAIARPAYPNGRYVAVAPRSTVPIPPRNQGNSNNKSIKPDSPCAVHSRNIIVKSTARKSTTPLPIGFSPLLMTARKSTAPLPRCPPGKKATARKSTTPIPRPVTRNSGLSKPSLIAQPHASSQNNPSDAIASTSRGQRNVRSSSRITSRTINSALQLKEESSNPSVRLERLSPEAMDGLKIPPLKIKLSLIQTKGKNTPRAAIQNTKRGRSRAKQSPIDDTDFTDTNVISKGRGRLRGNKSDQAKRNTSVQQGGKRTTPREGTGIGSDDDLLIVQEYLADSDESFDWEGERDEASSDSETESEDESEDDDSSAESIQPQHTVNDPMGDDTFDKKPIDSEDNKKIESEEAESNEVTKGASSTELKNTPEEAVPNELSESESEEVGPKEVTLIKTVFEAPKPKVIVKGTKEDADKALANLRNVLAQLSKNKTLTTLFRK